MIIKKEIKRYGETIWHWKKKVFGINFIPKTELEKLVEFIHNQISENIV
jgi:uncharacterized protein YlbG (UPF0298 family)